MNKDNWLEFELTSFKQGGKWYGEYRVLLPNDLTFYDRRLFLTKYIKEQLPENFIYVSNNSSVLGYPYMKVDDENETTSKPMPFL